MSSKTTCALSATAMDEQTSEEGMRSSLDSQPL